jgi:hypothetical protein
LRAAAARIDALESTNGEASGEGGHLGTIARQGSPAKPRGPAASRSLGRVAV